MTKIKSILWVQHEDAAQNAYLVVDNEFKSKPDDNLYHLVNHNLLKVFSLSIFDQAMVRKYNENSNNMYFQLGSGLFKGVAYRSCFVEKDEMGKEKPFMFWKSSQSLKDFIKDAKLSAAALGKTLNDNELRFVEKYIKRIRIRRIALCFSVVLIAMMLVLFI